MTMKRLLQQQPLPWPWEGRVGLQVGYWHSYQPLRTNGFAVSAVHLPAGEGKVVVAWERIPSASLQAEPGRALLPARSVSCSLEPHLGRREADRYSDLASALTRRTSTSLELLVPRLALALEPVSGQEAGFPWHPPKHSPLL